MRSGNNRGNLQAPHINVALYTRGLLNRLVTRIYFAGNLANENDEVLALVPEDRRASLMAYPDPANPSSWSFDDLLMRRLRDGFLRCLS